MYLFVNGVLLPLYEFFIPIQICYLHLSTLHIHIIYNLKQQRIFFRNLIWSFHWTNFNNYIFHWKMFICRQARTIYIFKCFHFYTFFFNFKVLFEISSKWGNGVIAIVIEIREIVGIVIRLYWCHFLYLKYL